MLPLLPFAAGLLAGGLTVRLWRGKRAGPRGANAPRPAADDCGLPAETPSPVAATVAAAVVETTAAAPTAARPRRQRAAGKRAPANSGANE